MQTTAPGEITFPIVREHVTSIVTVSDDQLRGAMRFAFERMKIAIEPSGAAAVAAVMTKFLPKGKRIGVIISGGNVDAKRFAELLATA